MKSPPKEFWSPQTVVNGLTNLPFRTLQYAAYRDVSGLVGGLDRYAVAMIEVEASFQCADEATKQAAQELLQLMLGICQRHGRNTRSKSKTVLVHPTHAVDGSRIFISRRAGVRAPRWMTVGVYTACKFAFPGLGSLYRIALLTSVSNVRYTVAKEISVHVQSGPGWSQVPGFSGGTATELQAAPER